MKKSPTVSIIINTYNGEEYIGQAIDSALNQSYFDFEIIIWDNNSTDNTYNIVKSYSDSRIRYYKSKSHVSLGAARNLAISVSRGTYIAFLDDDDIWSQQKLEIQLRFFENKKVGMVISNSYFIDESNRVIGQLYEKKFKVPQGMVRKKLLENYYVSMETLMIRKSYLDFLSYNFDSQYNIIEEFDLVVRLSKHCELRYAPKHLSSWRVRANSMTWKHPNLFSLEKRLFLMKNIGELKESDDIYPSILKSITLSYTKARFWSHLKEGKKNLALKRLKVYRSRYPKDIKIRLLIISMYVPIDFRPLFFWIQSGSWSWRTT